MRMKISLAAILVIFVFITIIIPMKSMAGNPDNIATSIDNTNTNASILTDGDTDDTIIILKTKFLGLDKNLNAYRVTINITTNKLGSLTYIENYYYLDSNGKPTKIYSSNIYYDNILTNYNISFQILRPRNKLKSEYNLIEGIVILNNETITYGNISSAGTYRSYDNSTNNNYSLVVAQRLAYEYNKSNTKKIIRTSDILGKPNVTSIISDSSSSARKTPGFEIIAPIIILPIIYLIEKNKRRK